MKNNGWTVELDEFKAMTPKGVYNMTNVVATLNPMADRYIVIACHYDSKLMDFYFVGATDSAVPCAMMIYMAESLNQRLETFKNTVSIYIIHIKNISILKLICFHCLIGNKKVHIIRPGGGVHPCGLWRFL